jgi:hypothetical protein
VLYLSGRMRHDDVQTQRTLVLSTLILLGVTALLRALTDGECVPLRENRWLRWLAIAALPAFLLVMYLPPVGYLRSVPLSLAYYHELKPLAPADWLLVLAVAVPAVLLCLASDLLTRQWLKFEPDTPARAALADAAGSEARSR